MVAEVELELGLGLGLDVNSISTAFVTVDIGVMIMFLNRSRLEAMFVSVFITKFKISVLVAAGEMTKSWGSYR